VLVVQPVLSEGQGAVGLMAAVVQSLSAVPHHVCHSVLKRFIFPDFIFFYLKKKWWNYLPVLFYGNE
jgi:hypothetical protein